jgi:hypothetical protein
MRTSDKFCAGSNKQLPRSIQVEKRAARFVSSLVNFAVRQLCVKRFTEVADETKSTYCDILFTAVRNMKSTNNDKEKYNL